MNRFKEIQLLIESGNKNEAIELLKLFSGDVRDFSQCVSLSIDGGELKFESRCGTPEYAISTKEKVVEWVGGH